jgi:membrane protein implicated in regulation of membrane protease activity
MLIFSASETWPFASALVVMVGLSVVEGIGLFTANSPSNLLDSIIPDSIDGPDGPLGWLHVGKVPILVLLILFLAGFAICGYAIQAIAVAMSGSLLPAWIAIIPAAFTGISTVRGIGALLARIIPGDETSAVSEQTLIGRVGVVIQGTATDAMAAQAKVRDSNGGVHYVMVVPDIQSQTFEEGTTVLLVKKVGARFRCIANPHPELL